MNAITQPLFTIRYSITIGFADLTATYTWPTWLLGWLVRMLCQVIFFAVVGRLIGSGETERYLVIGNALMACAIEAMMVVPSSAWERFTGTLPLLVAAPADLAWVFVGRSLQWLPSGVATSVVALFCVGPFFGVRWTPASAVIALPLVVLTAGTTYCFGLFVAALVLHVPELRNVASSVTYLTMMAICGVEVPVRFWPEPLHWLAASLPLTYDLAALRALLSGAAVVLVGGRMLAGLAAGLAWLAVSVLAFRYLAERGRRNGSIEFGA